MGRYVSVVYPYHYLGIGLRKMFQKYIGKPLGVEVKTRNYSPNLHESITDNEGSCRLNELKPVQKETLCSPYPKLAFHTYKEENRKINVAIFHINEALGE